MECQHSPELSVIVVSFNTRDLTLDCLRSLEQETRDVDFEVIVVDNASADESAEAIAQHFPNVTLLPQGENLGFGRAVNLAAERARGEHLLLLNPDTRVLDAAVARLVDFARRHPDAGLYGGLTQYEDGSANPSSCWNRPTLWSAACQGLGLSALFPGTALFSPEVVRLGDAPAEQEVDIISGGFLMIRTALWRELGGFDPAFFMYGEDFDLALRARERGARPRITPEARIVHHGGASERDDGDRLVRLLRSKAQLFDRHWPRPRAWLGKRMLLLWALSRAVGYRLAAWVRPSASSQARAWTTVWGRRREIAHP